MAKIEENVLINLFNRAYEQELEAAEIKKGAVEDLKTFSENHEVELKSLKAAYALYKKYIKNNVPTESQDYYELISAVEDHFLINGDSE